MGRFQRIDGHGSNAPELGLSAIVADERLLENPIEGLEEDLG
jgi:hypothetical protein